MKFILMTTILAEVILLATAAPLVPRDHARTNSDGYIPGLFETSIMDACLAQRIHAFHNVSDHIKNGRKMPTNLDKRGLYGDLHISNSIARPESIERISDMLKVGIPEKIKEAFTTPQPEPVMITFTKSNQSTELTSMRPPKKSLAQQQEELEINKRRIVEERQRIAAAERKKVDDALIAGRKHYKKTIGEQRKEQHDLVIKIALKQVTDALDRERKNRDKALALAYKNLEKIQMKDIEAREAEYASNTDQRLAVQAQMVADRKLMASQKVRSGNWNSARRAVMVDIVALRELRQVGPDVLETLDERKDKALELNVQELRKAMDKAHTNEFTKAGESIYHRTFKEKFGGVFKRMFALYITMVAHNKKIYRGARDPKAGMSETPEQARTAQAYYNATVKEYELRADYVRKLGRTNGTMYSDID